MIQIRKQLKKLLEDWPSKHIQIKARIFEKTGLKSEPKTNDERNIYPS